jgi:hypothetical protein
MFEFKVVGEMAGRILAECRSATLACGPYGQTRGFGSLRKSQFSTAFTE